MLSARSLKHIKTSTFEKALTFRLDNQRQISLKLSHTCRYRKRLISLINSANFFEIITFACCEYSEYSEYISYLSFFLDLVSECQCNRRVMSSEPEGGVNLT